jgi:hypothetical protein
MAYSQLFFFFIKLILTAVIPFSQLPQEVDKEGVILI